MAKSKPVTLEVSFTVLALLQEVSECTDNILHVNLAGSSLVEGGEVKN